MAAPDQVIYMDNNATTRIAPEVLEAMMPYLSDYYGNPSSMHTFGGQVGRAVAGAREQVAALLGADPGEIVFTSCGTESDSTAILSALQTYPEKNHVVTTRVEHPAVKNLCDNLELFTGRKYHTTRLHVRRRQHPGRAAVPRQPHRRDSDRQCHVGQQRDRGHFPVENGAHRPRAASSPTPTRSRRWARSRSTCATRPLTFSASPATSSMPPRAWACSTCARARRSCPS